LRSHFQARTDQAGLTPAEPRTRSPSRGRIPAFARGEHAAAFALLALLLLVYLWKAVIEGQMLSAVSSLYGLAPWSAVAPSDISHFYNQLLIDQAKAHYPWDLLDRSAIHTGVFPAWNPLVLSGTPFFANSQSGLTSLFNLPLWILPLNYALGLVAWIKLSIGAFGTYLLARELRLGFWPGVLAGASYSLCAFNVTWLGHQTLVATSVWLPWLVLVMERVLRRGRGWDLLALTLLAALAMNGGHPGTETHVMGGAALYLLVRAGTITALSPRERLRRVGLSIGALMLGVSLMAVVLIPVIEASHGTAGRSIRAGGGVVLPGSTLKTALFPGWWGRPSEGNFGGPFNYVERTIYVGTVALVLAGLGLTFRSHWRRKLPFVAVGLLGIGVAFGLPIVRTLVVHLPAFDSIDDSRITVLFEFAVAVLAAFGLQAIIDSAANVHRRAWLVLAFALLAASIAVLAVDPSLHDIRTTINHFRTGHDFPTPPVLALTSIGWFCLFLAAIALVLALRQRARISTRTAAAVLVVIAAVDMYHFAAGFQPIGPASALVPPRTPAIAYLQRNAGGYRVFGIAGALDVDYSMNFGLKDPSGYDPPQPTERYLRLWQLANPTQSAAVEWLVAPNLSRTGLQAMNLLGVRYLLSAITAPLPSSLPLRLVYKGADALIFENPGAAPPAEVPAQIGVVDGESGSLAAVSNTAFDVRRQAVIERDQPGANNVHAGQGSVAIRREVDAEVDMSANLTRGGLVVLDDASARGWSVSVDGHPARALQVDDVMRGVDVPAGRHKISWRYTVPGLKLGAVISLIGLLVSLLIAARLVISRRARTGSTSTMAAVSVRRRTERRAG
jgi:Bacterial membrane protein YfhO